MKKCQCPGDAGIESQGVILDYSRRTISLCLSKIPCKDYPRIPRRETWGEGLENFRFTKRRLEMADPRWYHESKLQVILLIMFTFEAQWVDPWTFDLWTRRHDACSIVSASPDPLRSGRGCEVVCAQTDQHTTLHSQTTSPGRLVEKYGNLLYLGTTSSGWRDPLLIT